MTTATLIRRALFLLLLAPVAAIVLLLPGTSSTSAQTGGYLSFPGPSWGNIKVADDPAFTPSEMTIEAWVYARSSGCDSLVGKGYNTSYWLGICNGIRIYWNNSQPVTAPTPIPLNTWNHVAVTYDQTTTRIYLNGVLDLETTDLSGPIGLNTNPLRIGADENYFFTPQGGGMDEVRLWSVVRTEAEIAGSMNTPIDAPQAGLIASFNMEGSIESSVGPFTETLEGNAVLTSGPVPTQVPITPGPTFTPGPSGTPVPTDTPAPTGGPNPGDPAQKGDSDCDGDVQVDDALDYLNYEEVLGAKVFPCYNGVQPLGGGADFADFSKAGGYIEVANNPALTPTGGLTIEMLVLPVLYESSNSKDTCQSLIGNGYITGSYWLGLCEGHVGFYISGGDSYSVPDPIPLNTWTHVALTVEGTTARVYYDGVLQGLFPDIGPLSSTNNPIQIGGDPDYNRFPSAALDEVRLWNVARTESEIAANIAPGLVPPVAGLVALWGLSDATDSAGGYDGSVIDFVDFTDALPGIYTPDLNCDGYLDATDTLPLLAYLADVEYDLPVNCGPVGLPPNE